VDLLIKGAYSYGYRKKTSNEDGEAMSQPRMMQTGIVVTAIAIACFIGAKYYASSVTDEKIQGALNDMPGMENIKYDNVSVDLPGGDVHIQDIEISPTGGGKETLIEEIVIHDFDEDNDIPHYLNLSANGVNIEVTPANFGAASTELKKMGYETIKASFDLIYEYSEDSKALELNNLALHIEDMGEASLGISLENIYLDKVDLENPITLMPVTQALKVKYAQIKFDNDSLIEKLLAMDAKNRGMDVDDLVDQVEADIEEQIKTAKNEGDEFSVSVLAAMLDFVKDPDSISITIKPERPVSFEALTILAMESENDPTYLVKALNLRVEAK
jgi:hypothetical protein